MSRALVVPSAAVTVTSSKTRLARKVFTDDHGEYRILSLAPGFYTLRVHPSGFKAHELSGYQITVGQTGVIDIILQPAPVAANGDFPSPHTLIPGSIARELR
jgi:Carboxypeptidase regulatory-like domain